MVVAMIQIETHVFLKEKSLRIFYGHFSFWLPESEMTTSSTFK